VRARLDACLFFSSLLVPAWNRPCRLPSSHTWRTRLSSSHYEPEACKKIVARIHLVANLLDALATLAALAGLGANAVLAWDMFKPNPVLTLPAWILIGPFVLAYVMQQRALSLRGLGQSLLLQMQIERNTRGDSAQ